MISLRQKELSEWQKRNFGEHDDDILRVALGMAEEVGETCHQILKGVQKIRDGYAGIGTDEAADGVADTMIYGIQLLSLLNVNAEQVLSDTIEKILARDWKKDPVSGGTKIK